MIGFSEKRGAMPKQWTLMPFFVEFLFWKHCSSWSRLQNNSTMEDEEELASPNAEATSKTRCMSPPKTVVTWSIWSLVSGSALLLATTLVSWNSADIVSLFLQQLTPPSSETGSLARMRLEAIARDWDLVIKRLICVYAGICVFRGIVGLAGLGRRNVRLIRMLWVTTVGMWVIDVGLVIAFSAATIWYLQMVQSIVIPWYIWAWIIAPIFYFPFVGWVTCRAVHQYYDRIRLLQQEQQRRPVILMSPRVEVREPLLPKEIDEPSPVPTPSFPMAPFDRGERSVSF